MRIRVDGLHCQKRRALIVLVHVERPVTRSPPGFAAAFRAMTRVDVSLVGVSDDLMVVFRAARAFMNAFFLVPHAMTPAIR